MIDRVEIKVKGGDGGDGAISFRHEKFLPNCGPDGGEGGDGGDVILAADGRTSSLQGYERKRFYEARNGADGRGKRQHGKKGESRWLKVPVGTVILGKREEGGQQPLADLSKAEQSIIVARGGRGGWGNARFVSATNQVPRLAQKGEAGEERAVILELRIIADVGIIGYPNAGKSTLLRAVSAAKPKVAEYPFTTLEPVLGVVEVGRESLVLAEIPGLISGAHLGRGLGFDFLRHTTRTKVLIHLIDGTSPHALEDMAQVNGELRLFDPALGEKPQVVAVNKIDLPEVSARMDEIRGTFQAAAISLLFISAATGENVPELISEAARVVARCVVAAPAAQDVTKAVFRPQPKAKASSVHREGDVFVVAAPLIERIVARVDMQDPEVRQQLQRELVRFGVRRELQKAGIKPGDKVRCGDFEWQW